MSNELTNGDDVLAMIERDAALSTLLDEVRRRMEVDPAHDVAHLVRVAHWAVRLSDGVADPRLAIAAALLHDIINIPKFSPERPLASERSAAVARQLMGSVGFEPSEVEIAAGAIRDHSYTRGAVPETALGRALQDADRLDALGVIGTFRCMAMGSYLGLALVDAEDPWAATRALDDRRFALDHFFTKLLRLPETFQTDAGKAEALRRTSVMRALLAELGRELEEAPPWASAPRRRDAEVAGSSSS